MLPNAPKFVEASSLKPNHNRIFTCCKETQSKNRRYCPTDAQCLPSTEIKVIHEENPHLIGPSRNMMSCQVPTLTCTGRGMYIQTNQWTQYSRVRKCIPSSLTGREETQAHSLALDNRDLIQFSVGGNESCEYNNTCGVIYVLVFRSFFTAPISASPRPP